jgi:hypothetical protein
MSYCLWIHGQEFKNLRCRSRSKPGIDFGLDRQKKLRSHL